MKKDYNSPEWKLVLIQANNILSNSYEFDPEDPWSKDY